MDKQKHKLYMAQILSLIFKDKELSNVLGGSGFMVKDFKIYNQKTYFIS